MKKIICLVLLVILALNVAGDRLAVDSSKVRNAPTDVSPSASVTSDERSSKTRVSVNKSVTEPEPDPEKDALNECVEIGVIDQNSRLTVVDVDRCKKELETRASREKVRQLIDTKTESVTTIRPVSEVLAELVPVREKQRVRAELKRMDSGFLERFKRVTTKVKQLEQISDSRGVGKLKEDEIVSVFTSKKSLDDLYAELTAGLE